MFRVAALLAGGCTAIPIEPVSTTEPTSPPVPLTIGPVATYTYEGVPATAVRRRRPDLRQRGHRETVASPDVSQHVVGQAVDVAPVDADKWPIRNGAQFGLCQIYANELWHFELAVDQQGNCPPLRPNAAG